MINSSNLADINYEPAKKFILEYLIDGTPLQRKIYETVSTWSGEIKVTSLAPKIDEINFDSGYICKRQESLTILSTYIFENINQNKNKICIFESEAEQKSDEDIDKSGTALFYDENVLHLINYGMPIHQILSTINFADTSIHTVGIMSNSVDKSLMAGADLSPQDICSICSNADHLIVCVYDNEAFLIWKK